MLYTQYPSWLTPEIIPGLPIRWYGLMYLLAFGTCYLITIAYVKQDKETLGFLPKISNLFFWSIVGLLLGARIVSEIIYSKNPGILLRPWLIFWPFDSSMTFVGIQGMSYHGGLLGAIVATIIYCKVSRMPIWVIMDKMTIGASLGYFFGRLGNFTNGELYGRVTSSPFGMVFPYAEKLPYGDERVRDIADTIGLEPDAFGLVNLPRHPSQLYEAFFESIVVFIILYFLYKKIRHTKHYIPGMFLVLYVIGYGLARFIVEYFRQPDVGLEFVIRLSKTTNPRWLFMTPFNFTTGQILSSIMIASGAIILLIMYIRHKAKNIMPKVH